MGHLGTILAQLGATLTLSWLILELIFAQLAPCSLIWGLSWHILDAFERILEQNSQQEWENNEKPLFWLSFCTVLTKAENHQHWASWCYLRPTWWRIQLGAILTLSWPILKPILPQPVLLLAHLKPVCAHLGRIWANRNPKRNEKALENHSFQRIFRF